MLKILITVTLVATLLTTPIHPLLALSWAGIEHLYLWQLLTYLLVEPLSFHGLVELAFNMYLLWIFGTSLIERARPRTFLLLYFGAALSASLAALLPLYFFPGVLHGSTAAVYAIMIAWMMLNPHSQLLLFFAIPLKAHWLITGLLGLTLFLDLSQGHWVGATSLIASSLFGYLFTVVAWREQGPFAAFRPFERSILRFLERRKAPYQSSKIYDIQSGAPVLDDEQFMDAMLDKISRLGEDALTPQEKKRMQTISAKKKS